MALTTPLSDWIDLSPELSNLPGLGKGRLEALTDGIFATVMTVLVLSLSVPVVTSSGSGSQLSAEVFPNIESNLLGYVLSFLLLAVLWTSHHNVFHYITRVDRPLLWLNTIFLLTIGFIPFSTSLIGRYPLVQVPVVIYGTNIVATGLSMLAILSYSASGKLMIVPEHEEVIMGRIRTRWRQGTLLYFGAILLSFLSPAASFAVYVGTLTFMILQSTFGFRRRH